MVAMCRAFITQSQTIQQVLCDALAITNFVTNHNEMIMIEMKRPLLD